MSISDIKESTINWIKLIASKEAQLDYAKVATKELAGDELVETWFSIYVPDDFLHRRTFTNKEILALKEFSDRLDKVCGALPSNIEELHETSDWSAVVVSAQDTVEKCCW